MALKKPSGSSGAAGIDLRAGGAGFDQWPSLWDFLAVGKWDDGSARQVGSMTLFVDEGAMKACLNDKERGLVMFVTSTSLEGLLTLADGMLASGQGDWRVSKPARRTRPA